MKQKIEDILRKLAKFNLLPEYIKVSVEQAFKQLPTNDKEVVFTLDDNRLFRDMDGSGRYAYLVLNLFTEAGYNVYLHKKVSFLAYTRLGKYGRFIYDIPNLKIVANVPQKTEDKVYVFDTVYKEILDKPWKKRTYVNLHKPPSAKVGEVIPIAYFTHPMLYKLKQLGRVGDLQKSERRLRIFFGGNTAHHYTNPNLGRLYGQMTRMEGITVVSQLAKVKTFQSLDEVFALLNGEKYVNECRLLRTDNVMIVEITKWLDLVAKSDFFLCLSGTDYPYCHNAVEAIAVGTIPITSYADWFTPSLEHKKNAIIYSGAEDLVRKINEVLAMGDDEIKQMRKNVIDYYNTHLGAKNFMRRYESHTESPDTIIFHKKLVGTNSENREGERSLTALKEYFGAQMKEAAV